MNRRLVVLLTLLLAVSCAAYLKYRRQSHMRLNPFLAPNEVGLVEPDAFDTPYESDPALVAEFANRPIEFPFKKADRVAWIGSSSTFIGVWPKTMEFLLRSRHPELELTFSRHSTGGGSYADAANRLTDWLERSNPTLVFFNFGGNDALGGKQFLDGFHDAMRVCSQLALNSHARVFHITPQSGDIRKTGPIGYFRRKHYSDDMLAYCKVNSWDIVDVHHPLENLQRQTQVLDASYSINADVVHLTDAGYVAWAFFQYDRLNPVNAVSSLEIDAKDRRVISANRCAGSIMESESDFIFMRQDDMLPILPPNTLPAENSFRLMLAANSLNGPIDLTAKDAFAQPQRRLVPFEKQSQYLLKITGLSPGDYALECNGKPVGHASEKEFAAGVNLVTMVLDAGVPAPWNDLAVELWNGAKIAELVNRKLIFKIKRKS